jgi:endonuclease/exonuclease/phosphatase family metal-dependent hydrolase
MTASPASPGRLRVASYNIHRCVGLDGKHAPERIAAVIDEMRADVVGLQEVDSLSPALTTADARHHMEYLAGALQMTAVAGPTICHDDRHYGNALLTRRRVQRVRHIDLTVDRREPRAALDVMLEIPGGSLRFVVTHLGLFPAERRVQVKRLLGALTTSDHPWPLLVLCGDINEWFTVGRPLRWLHDMFGRSPSHRTFPSAFPLFALDRIWVRPVASVVGWAVHDSPTARVASDHLPLRADIDVPPAPAPSMAPAG